ncbi:MAG: proprotein convertase P-domain-containing protein, partial [Pyrinomonadaceae bacterium]
VGTVNKVTVTLTGIEHTFPSDIDVLLVGPQGQKMILMSDAGGGTDINNVTLTFDDAAAAALPATLVSGTFRPTNVGTGDTFPAPAPAAPYGSALSVFSGTNPNGTWSLYALDDAGVDDGTIAGGWSLTITTDVPVCVSSPCTLGLPADITVANDGDVCGAVVSYPATTVVGSCGVVTGNPAAGSFFPVGANTVTVTGTRQDGTTTVGSFKVTVNDEEKPDVSASLTPVGHVSHGSGNFRVGFGAADNCAVAMLRAVMFAPPGAAAFRVYFGELDDDDDDDGGGQTDAKIIIDYDRRRVTLEGRNRTTLRNLLAELLANGGLPVQQGQVLRLQLHKPDDDDDDDGPARNNRYEFSFWRGVLTKVKAPSLELKATAVDA